MPPLIAYSLRGNQQPRERAAIGGASKEAMFQRAYLADPSDLAGLAALLPGVVSAGDSGYSVMGASPDQNSTLLDGMNFDGGSLPPDAACSIRLATTTSDPARGQFTGGQVSATTCNGTDLVESKLRISGSEPWLAWADPRSLQQPAQGTLASGFFSGPIKAGVAHFRASLAARDFRHSTPSLLGLTSTQLAELGVRPDTLQAFVNALAVRGIPLTSATSPSGAANRSASGLLTIDWSLGAVSALKFTASGEIAAVDGLGLSATALPSTGGRLASGTGRAMIRASTYFLGAFDELSAVGGRSQSDYSPGTLLPSGSVRIGTSYSTGLQGTSELQFGGTSRLSHRATNELSLRNITSINTARRTHQLSLGEQVTFESRNTLGASDAFGRYTYASLADLSLNRPSAYSRALDSTKQSGSAATGAVWVSDVWRALRTISFEGGLRADFSHFGDSPAYNPAIDTLFGLRTDHLPPSGGVSPRLGFAWLIEPVDLSPTTSKTGQTVEYMYIDPADRADGEPRGNEGGGTTLFGDIGAYRGASSLAQVLPLRERTGLPSEARSLGCVGDQTPIPDWNAVGGAVFSTCRGGAGSGTASGSAPAVSVMSPGYRPPTDWKLNLGLNRFVLGGGYIEMSAIILREYGTPSVIDRNLLPVPQFRLADEANRPVFVRSTDLEPATGFFGPLANRVATSYGGVTELRSDLHRTAVQLNLSVTTAHLLPISHAIPALIQYSFNQQSREERGFDGTSAGNPFEVETVHGSQPIHQLTISTLSPFRLWWFAANVRLTVQSGTAYTPMVAGDVNGDGLSSNDRAFVVNPATTPDTLLAGQMNSLLRSTPASARQCLESQMGKIAGPNSCRGPWQARVDVNLELAPPAGLALGGRLHLSTTFLNAGAALLRLLGVSGSLVQGGAPVDPVLLNLTGYDPGAQRFLYHVNPGFGRPIGASAGTAPFPAFQLRVGLEYQFAGRELNPYLKSLGIDPRGSAASRDSAVHRLVNRIAVDPVDLIVASRDSLLLSDGQVAGLAVVQSRFVSRRDSAATPVVDFVLKRGRLLVDNEMEQAVSQLFQVISQARVDARDAALRLLLPDQQVKLGAMLRAGVPR